VALKVKKLVATYYHISANNISFAALILVVAARRPASLLKKEGGWLK
jgi:hypothetical protein